MNCDRGEKLTASLFSALPLRYLWDEFFTNIAASRCIFGPFEQYGHPKNAPQKVLATLISYTFHVKTSLRTLKSKNLFKRHKYSSPNALNIK